MRKILLSTLVVVCNVAAAEGFYYPAPTNPPGYVYALPPAYIAPPQYYYRPPVYLAPPPPSPGIIRGQPPVFVPFDTGRVVPREKLEGFK